MLLHRPERKSHTYKTFKTSGTSRVNKLDDCHIKFDGKNHRIPAPDHTKAPTLQNYLENLYKQKSDFESIGAAILSWTLTNMQSMTALLYWFWLFFKHSMILGSHHKSTSWALLGLDGKVNVFPPPFSFNSYNIFLLLSTGISLILFLCFVSSCVSLKERNSPH